MNDKNKTRHQLMQEVSLQWLTIRRQLRQIRSLRSTSSLYRKLYRASKADMREKYPATFNLND